jgi:Fur family ferric uptake transcriptional regulator
VPTASPIIHEWIERLQASGYRVTATRQTIVELLVSSSRALSPIEIYDLGRKEYSALGLVTVYRTLERLEELGLVQRVHMTDGCHRYLRAPQGHQHLLLCICCGQIEVFEGDDLSKLIQKVEDTTGYHIQDHWLQLFGLCPRCTSQSKQ